jgi:hypothetical protein
VEVTFDQAGPFDPAQSVTLTPVLSAGAYRLETQEVGGVRDWSDEVSVSVFGSPDRSDQDHGLLHAVQFPDGEGGVVTVHTAAGGQQVLPLGQGRWVVTVTDGIARARRL